MASRTTGEEALASRIAPEILRFHVLAESDSARDQNLKLGVKGLVLDYIHGQVPEDADKEQLEQWIEGNKTSIETMAQDWLADQGASYPVKLELTRDYFPTKLTGTWYFPAAPMTRSASPLEAEKATTGGACSIPPYATPTPSTQWCLIPPSKPCHPCWRKMTTMPCYPPLTGQNSRSKSRRSAYGSGSWIYFIKKAEILFFWLSSMS